MKTITIGDQPVVLGVTAGGFNCREVPHGRHVPTLHARDRELLDEVFPGFTKQLVQTWTRGHVEDLVAEFSAPWTTGPAHGRPPPSPGARYRKGPNGLEGDREMAGRRGG